MLNLSKKNTIDIAVTMPFDYILRDIDLLSKIITEFNRLQPDALTPKEKRIYERLQTVIYDLKSRKTYLEVSVAEHLDRLCSLCADETKAEYFPQFNQLKSEIEQLQRQCDEFDRKFKAISRIAGSEYCEPVFYES